MPRLFSFIFIVIFFIIKSYETCCADVEGGYIQVKADPASLVCQVRLFLYSESGSSVFPGNGELNFGDGSRPLHPVPGNPDEFLDVGNGMSLNIYNFSHAFPGPGIYIVNYRESNRNAGISNILNSADMPFCIETMIHIDPFTGNNSSPHIANHFPVWVKTNSDYLYSLMATDAENDSLSYLAAIPLGNSGMEVDSFFTPTTIREEVTISRMFVASTTGDIIWQQAYPEGVYQFSVRIDEWRKHHGDIIHIGYMIFDFQIIVVSTDDVPLQISSPRDTAFLHGQDREMVFKISGGVMDSTRLELSTGLVPPVNTETDLYDSINYPVPVTGKVSIRNTSSARVRLPYKFVLSASGSGSHKLQTQKDFFVWFTESPSSPLSPEKLKAETLNSGGIFLSWNDHAGQAAGYTVERSDTYNPEFIRIAVLPGNATSFTDTFILGSRFYFYRVKAIGTEYSSASDTIGVFSSGILTKVPRFPMQAVLRLYPNPADHIITLTYSGINPGFNAVHIYTLSGLQIKYITIPENENLSIIEINIEDLAGGAYVLAAFDGSGVPRWATFVKE